MGADLQPQRIGDRQPLGIQRFQQAPHVGGDILPLAPVLATLHPGHVAERNAHVVLRVQVGERDRQQPVARLKPVAEQALAERQGFARAVVRRGAQVDQLAHRVDLYPRRRLPPPGHRGRAPGGHRHADPPRCKLLAEIDRAQRGVGGNDHMLACPDMGHQGVHHRLVAIGGQRDQKAVILLRQLPSRSGNAGRQVRHDGAFCGQRLSGRQRRRTSTGRRPQHRVMPVVGQQRRSSASH